MSGLLKAAVILLSGVILMIILWTPIWLSIGAY